MASSASVLHSQSDSAVIKIALRAAMAHPSESRNLGGSAAL
jgi:hypothetical protein